MGSRAPDDEGATTPRAAGAEDTERDLAPPRSRSRDAAPARDAENDSETLGENTLMSAKAAAEAAASRPARPDPEQSRVEELERRLSQLEARLKVLELARGARLGEDKRWLLWVAVLLALALGWQLRAAFR